MNDETIVGKGMKAVISEVRMECVGDDEKPVLHLRDQEKLLPLNKTNATSLAEAYGENTDDWVGKPVILRVDKTHFQGRTVPCLRVSIPEKQQDDGDEVDS